MVTFVTQNLRMIIAALLAFALTVIPRLVFGQDAPPEAVSEGLMSGGWQVFWVIAAVGGGVVIFLAAWALNKLGDWLDEAHGHTAWAGFVTRLINAIEDELQLSWDDLSKALAEARDINSPGGSSITAEEHERLVGMVWEGLKSRYGGLEQLTKLGGRVLGGDVERIVKGKIGRRVSDAIEGQAGGKPGPRREAPANP